MVWYMFRRRARVGEQLSELHRSFLLDSTGSGQVEAAATKADAACGRVSPHEHLGISEALPQGFAGSVCYVPRSEELIEDHSSSDDYASIEEHRSIEFVDDGVVGFLGDFARRFTAYRACLYFDRYEYGSAHNLIVEESRKTGLNVDGRDTVYRFFPVNYFDNELCCRAFKRSAASLAKRMAKHVEMVEVDDRGVLILVTREKSVSSDLQSELKAVLRRGRWIGGC
ncbi:hypothetical protein Pla123a_49280 [Posidoniimonas polymericola]|uniref:Uncharacterized protein n=1 Tax=Posidoniimonas polymericola TaxID=2528002 RepID=A0A5C5XQJ0_9BACT|nr:hypothetical protein [Posidoniimonas polymericola]TWT65164.1 hypothetical protein Pla123a_49280 [Posidoniimonas polymericola]